ncbi:LysR family transcriptional regulator [Corticimicrobacter populi]|uniref:LysR family transcriptional regulator n=1 Tax=Corticimicrobacter populi TaxID=2175229 RepID=A0A2V1JW71_9BURK|nr:LysR family transcriptional regulator [Corticimicrobacter populi]PWF22575.1 LysR family transcriptional regulator [Corticimicrobacter populi]
MSKPTSAHTGPTPPASLDPALCAHPVFSDLHLLTLIGETRSYTQTARRLGLSKATVSQRISALERATGVPLVRRTTRAVTLTAAGVQLVEDTRPAFARIEQSFAAVRDLASQPRGLVRLTAPVALGRQYVMPMLADFLSRHPEIRVELDLNDRLVHLGQEGFDLAIRHTHTPPDSSVAWPLCDTRSLLVASPDYLARCGTPACPEDLTRHACLVYLRAGLAASSWTLTRTRRRQPTEQVSIPVWGPIKANNSETLRDAALAGLGVALLPDFSAMPALQAVVQAEPDGHPARTSTLVTILPDWEPQGFFGARIYAIRPWTPQVPRAVQCLVEFLRAGFADVSRDWPGRPRPGQSDIPR